MATSRQHGIRIFEIGRPGAPIALAMVMVLVLAVLFTPSAQAQTFNVIHNFTGGGDGAMPGGLTSDAAGNLYGTTNEGGAGYGIVFKLKHSGSGWILTPLYSFAGGNDGAYPGRRVTIGRDGTLYGTTHGGGIYGSGTVFRLTPPPTAPRSALVPWNETVLHSFNGSDGTGPNADLIFDQAGSLYGTTFSGGFPYCNFGGCGVVYKLTPTGSGWTVTLLYSFVGNEGENPVGGVVFDASGNLYGATVYGGSSDYGVVYQLSPSGGGWTEQTLHAFTGRGGSDGGYPSGGLTMDASGNLYGLTSSWGNYDGGTLFELMPGSGGWTFNTLESFYNCCGGGGPADKLVMDSARNLYGVLSREGRYAFGSVFKRHLSNDGWFPDVYILYDFTGGDDGSTPSSAPALDATGNLYGTTDFGGAYARGVVWEITP